MVDDADHLGCPTSSALADAVSDRLFAFDAELRIAWTNKAFRCAFGLAEDAVERMLCEVLQCRHSDSACGGGKAPACGDCGWFLAVAACLRSGEECTKECRILSRKGAAFDFGVTVFARRAEGAGPVGLCALQDLSCQKRLRVLERTFFHDVTNLAAGIRGLCEIASGAKGGPDAELVSLLHGNADKMMDEIQRLRVLHMAENGGLVVTKAAFLAGELLRAVVARYADETAARRLEVSVIDGLGGVPVMSERDLLHVVLCDVFQNAVEASGRGDRVSLSCEAGDGEIVFRVVNPAVLADEVSAHLFERSFTTRGAGKGVGAYRAKLLCERYLDGKISVLSQVPGGTVVSVALRIASETVPG